MDRQPRVSAVAPESDAGARQSDVVAAVKAHRVRITMLNRQLGAARDEERHWLERYFLRTRDAARRLGVSPRLLQALASEGPMMLLDHDGRPVEVGLRFVRQRGYWFLREDVERILRARRGAD